MAELIRRQFLQLRPEDDGGRLLVPSLVLDPQTSRLTVRLRRPTTAAPLAWDVDTTVRVSILLTVDGVVHRYSGQATGGIHTSGRTGLDVPEYLFSVMPTWGWFGRRSGNTQRLGETAKVQWEAALEIVLLRGELNTEIELISIAAPAPPHEFRSSVAFDAATDASELSGDGVLSLSHIAGGADRAAFAGVGWSDDPVGTSTGVTYGGSGMTELWDIQYSSNWGNAGYRLAGIASGAQTVESTLSGSPDVHFLAVISMTGVDQTTPVGTPETVSGYSTSSEVVVGSLGSDDLVCDNFVIASFFYTPSTGANQVVRNTEALSFAGMHQSTQLGSFGGTMLWDGYEADASLGAVAFKAAAGGPTQEQILPTLVQMIESGGMVGTIYR